MSGDRNVHVQKGQTVIVHAGRGAIIEVTRDLSGAVELRNLVTGNLVRQWSPKEARTP